MTVVLNVGKEISEISSVACRTGAIAGVWFHNDTFLLHSWATISLTKRTDLKHFAKWAPVRDHMQFHWTAGEWSVRQSVPWRVTQLATTSTTSFTFLTRHQQNITVFWDVAPCRLVDGRQMFSENSCFHLQSGKIKTTPIHRKFTNNGP
jgi:hypothetical protein